MNPLLPGKEALSRSTLLGYSAGSLVETSIYCFCGLYLLNFYTDVVHLDPRLIGYAFAIRFFVDAASDPAIGHVSDKTRTSLGRRRPYFLLGAIPGAVAFYLLLTPPAGSQTAIFLHLTASSTLMLFALTVFGVPYHALSWELTSNYDERTRIAAWRRVVEVGAELLATLTIPLLLAWAARRNHSSTVDEAAFYPTAALVIGGTAVAAAIVTFFGTSEIPRSDARDRYGFWESLAMACRNKPFVILLATGTLIAVADQVAMSLLFYLMEHLHGIPKQNAHWLFLAFFAGSFSSPPLWLLLAQSVGKKRAYLSAILFWGAAFTSVVINAWSEATLCLVAALMGAGSSGVFLLPDALLPDVIEWDQLRTGERHEGMYAGVAKFSWKVGTGACFFVVGHVLHAIGYVGGTEPTAEVLGNLRFFFAAFPGLLLTMAVVVFGRFPITAESFRKMVTDLEQRRAPSLAACERTGPSSPLPGEPQDA